MRLLLNITWIGFLGGSTGNQMGGWFKKEINNIDDLKGLKIRIVGVAGEIYSKLGAIATNIPPGEMYTSLDRGVIDAVEWVSPAFDFSLGFHKITKHYYTGWHEPGAENVYFVNKKSFNKLPKDLQSILKVSMEIASNKMAVYSDHQNAKYLQKIKEEHPDIKILDFPKGVMEEFRKANDIVLSKIFSKSDDPLTKKIMISREKYFENIKKWTDISQRQYYNKR